MAFIHCKCYHGPTQCRAQGVVVGGARGSLTSYAYSLWDLMPISNPQVEVVWRAYAYK